MTLVVDLGSIAIDTFTGVRSLIMNLTANKYNTFELPEGTKYQVPADKILYITKIKYQISTAGKIIRLGYGDDAVNQAAGAPTNDVVLTPYKVCQTAYDLVEESIFIYIPAGKYPFLYGNDACKIEALGYEI